MPSCVPRLKTHGCSSSFHRKASPRLNSRGFAIPHPEAASGEAIAQPQAATGGGYPPPGTAVTRPGTGRQRMRRYSSYQSTLRLAHEFQTMTSTTSRLAVIREKVEAGERLSFDDGLFLYDEADLFTLGELANRVRERKNGHFT